MSRFDRKDAEILRLLQRDALMPQEEIGKKVGLSPSPVFRRIEAMKKAGYITGQHVAVSRAKLGLNTTVFTFVQLTKHGSHGTSNFEEQIAASMPNITECVRLSGTWDYLLRFVARDMEHYGQLQQRLTALDSVKLLRSFPAMGQIQTAPLPIE